MWRPVSEYAERRLAAMLYEGVGSEELFLRPSGEAGFVPADSLTARIYAVPLTVFIGGIAAVILELAEPRVRHGVWDHSIFPSDPVLRLRRTGLAAMVTFYGARSVAEDMIAAVRKKHAAVTGVTDSGEAYRANDPQLLKWVQATAAYGFIGAYDRYAENLRDADWDRALAEARPVAEAYGVSDPPMSRQKLDALLADMLPRLEPSQTLHDFFAIMRTAPALPQPGKALQPLFVRGAVSLLPQAIRERIDLLEGGLRPGEEAVLKTIVKGSRLLSLRNHPAALQEKRLAVHHPGERESVPSG
ncbi:oxygenase MpaB family protein [Parvularcula lutaonensis]|uniref:Oxygenase MpaB family protein n=1 Tax=Parvularcula lutaonensis TaxID=491923 RepID=A0ABV7MF82_9PROT|nr:oxygenase MpaB family protein [Parvularcula lutaonensis]GGY55147.1 histidine kinase [Parvularcula lutaonensis]